jgi:SAM-dependent methyltransferase
MDTTSLEKTSRLLPRTFPAAVCELLTEFAENTWFLNSYWPENAPRVKLLTELGQSAPTSGSRRRTLEVGCATGYVAYLFSLLGDDVCAVDAYDDDNRAALFAKRDIEYRQVNLNDVVPLSEFADASFDLVLLGEVFEHILNQPAGLLRAIFRVLRPGGILLLDTPNPSTVANALRVLFDRYVMWGTDKFLRETKFDSDKVIDRGDIHYHEYPAWLIKDLLCEVGFNCSAPRYIPSGIAPSWPWKKRAIKAIINATGLGKYRLFGLCYVLVAHKPAH